jgi:peroxiredoxin
MLDGARVRNPRLEQIERQNAAERQSATIQIGPGRDAYTKRARSWMAVVVLVAVAAVVVLAVVGAMSSKHPTPHAVTIPAADRAASAALRKAAEQIGFHSNAAAGAGTIEDSSISATNPAPAKGLLPIGSKAPGFTLQTPAGQSVSLASLRGKTVLLEAFATWCPHCAAEAPHLKAMYQSLPKQKYAFVGLNADGEDAASVLAYHIFFGLPFPALLDPNPSDPGSFSHEGGRGPVSKAYKVGLFPTFYVIDPQGKIAWTAEGEQADALLLRELRAASSK